MIVEYENTLTDVLAFQAFNQFRSRMAQLVALSTALYIFSWRLHFFSHHVEFMEWVWGAADTAIAYVSVWVLQFIFNAMYFASRSNKSVLTRHTVQLLDTELIEETRFNRSHFYWSGIEKITSTFGGLSVYITANSAVFIPRRAFESAESMKTFFTVATHKCTLGKEVTKVKRL